MGELTKSITGSTEYLEWKAELIRITAHKTATASADIKINDEEAARWYVSGFTPSEVFRETWQMENDSE